MKKILGLDLGTTSIGWALVNEAEKEDEKSSIIRTGVRVIPLTTDESDNFEKGKAVSVNANRTLKRGARRNLQRYKQRREHLFKLLVKNNIISNDFILAETGKNSTHSLWALRAKAATEQISLEDFARVLFAINKKRGYKSNRKAKDENDGQAVDGMELAKKLYNEGITPGQLVLERLQQGKKHVPDFYPSDLQNEFDRIWTTQKKFYPELLTDELKENLKDKNAKAVYAICQKPFNLVGIKRTGNALEKKLENYTWRVAALTDKLSLEQLVVVFQEINAQIKNSSGYLGKISDRSKELYFRKQTVGQYLFAQLKSNPHTSLKNQVFYRQDYLDEFEKIWSVQSKGRENILTDELKSEIRDTVIFYQRRLKSQKGLIGICELEGKEIEVTQNGKTKKILVGPRVIPKSSPLFQEFKIWQILNNLIFINKETRETVRISDLDEDMNIRKQMFQELNIKGKLTANEILKATIQDYKKWEVKNYKEIEGNNTFSAFYKAFEQIVELSGHEIDKVNPIDSIREVFKVLGINTDILEFNSELKGDELEKQPFYQLWHLLYSYEGDNSETGNEKLYLALKEKFGFDREYARFLINITFQNDYGKLSAKAIKKILPYLKAGHDYSEACSLAKYNHSHSITKEENEKRVLQDSLDLLPKNSLRNPVVEKILNQMVNVVNAIIKKYGKPDEIRLELARELKKSAKERAEMTKNIANATKEHEAIKVKLQKIYPFNTGVRITKNDIIKFKLYEELAPLGYKTIYTNTYIPQEKLFSKEFDIEHIIPKALLFDDSYSNKTLAVRDFNRIKSNKTGIDAVTEKYGENSEEFNRYIKNVEKLYAAGKISNSKYNKLLMKGSDIPDGFVERDMRNTQYISKKAQEMLKKIVRTVTPTTGSITERLREDWQLINVLQELNWEKYNKLGLTEYEINKEGKKIPVIKDWTKRNDHRHHAMDALTVAFTKPSIIQYFNYLNARNNENHKKHAIIQAIERKETTFLDDKNKRVIKPPIPLEEFREEAKRHLESILVSFKAKNKVVTRNLNRTKKKGGENIKVELTPRGELHEETIYGKSYYYVTKEEKVGTKFDWETIQKVANKNYREALLKRLEENNNDPAKAFGGKNALSKNPIYLDEHQLVKLPEKVKLVWLEERYTIRKDITPKNFSSEDKIKKIIDAKQRKILLDRLKDFNGDAKAAFSNLEENPIWLNKEKGIQLKRVTITSYYNNLVPIRIKKDHFGKEILDKDGKSIPSDLVNTGNNHHVAIYKDENGNLHEEVVSFFEAVARVKANNPLIWYEHPQHPDWQFQFTMKQNEYFVFPNEETGFNPADIDLMDESNYYLISPNLFRVQKIATKNYLFAHHLETKAVNNDTLKVKGLSKIIYNLIQTPNNLKGIIKVHINHIGQIVKVGE